MKTNKRVAFSAQIKLISVKSLITNDTEGELKLRFLPTEEVLEVLHRLHRGDANVMVVVMPLDNENKREIPKRKQRSQGTTQGGEV